MAGGVLRRGAGGVARGLAAPAALLVDAGAGGAGALAEAAVAVHVVGLALDLAALPGGGALGFLAVASPVDRGVDPGGEPHAGDDGDAALADPPLAAVAVLH